VSTPNQVSDLKDALDRVWTALRWQGLSKGSAHRWSVWSCGRPHMMVLRSTIFACVIRGELCELSSYKFLVNQPIWTLPSRVLTPDCEREPKLPNNAVSDTRLPQTIAAFPVKGSSDAMSNEQTDLMEPLRSCWTRSRRLLRTPLSQRIATAEYGSGILAQLVSSVSTPLRPRIDRSTSSSPKSIEPGTGRVFTMAWPRAGAAMAKASVYRCPR
jgi:hypothetical protein